MSASHIKIGDELLQDAILQLVEVTEELNRHSYCRVDCWQTKDERIPVEEMLGKDLQIVTYAEDGTENVVFDGFILEASIEYAVFGAYQARLTAVTRSYKLAVTEQHAYFAKKPLAQIASALCGMDGLEAIVKAKDLRPLNYVQWGECDFDFLRRIADDHGCWMRPTAQGIEIRDEFESGTAIQWSEEGGLVSFRVSGALAPAAFRGTHYDPQQMTSQTYNGIRKQPQFFDSVAPMVDAVLTKSSAQMPEGYLKHRCRTVTLQDYEALLKKESERSLGAQVFAEGVSRDARIRAGNTVEIEGMPDCQGEYGVIKVLHRWLPTGYTNEFRCTPWKNYTEPDPPEPRQWLGVVPGRVVEHHDPLKMGRIRVQYIWQEEGPAHWARMMTPHAGSERGFMFMPEIGDEVVVTFEDGDPERPLILGCVWNGVDKAPRQDFWGGDIEPNDVKRIMTKSGHRMQFIDKKGKESIVVATPKHLKISMIETTDETGRSMVTLHSENGDIFLSAPNGRIHLLSKYYSREVGEEAPPPPPVR